MKAISKHLHHEYSNLARETHVPGTSRQGLRIFTCGSVDDGKSTLIGRLLFDSKLILNDQMRSLEKDSRKYGTIRGEIDLALLVDGLEAEREQGMTIDVAYRYFATAKRSFIVADTPGHEQYTRNMVTGASTAQLAVLLVDARKGLLPQTFRHSIICNLLGVRHILLAINKMDLVSYDQNIFKTIRDAYVSFSAALNFANIAAIPISARCGDNVTFPGSEMDWYDGPTLLDYLETVEVDIDFKLAPFRMPVQWVNRTNLDFRGICGTISSGIVRPDDKIIVVNSGVTTSVRRIVTFDGDRDIAVAGDAVTLILADEVDTDRGDVLADPKHRAELANQFAAHLVWMDQKPLFPGRSYLIRIGHRFTSATITNLKHKINVETLVPLASKILGLNDIGECNVELLMPAAFDPYHINRDTGSFILVDRETNATVGAGMILHGLRRAQNVHHQNFSISKSDRAIIKNQKPCVLWFTGLSGSGKSTIANLVEQRLYQRGHHTISLDGDNFRQGLNRDLGFTPQDRVENIRRAGEVARFMVEAGLIVLCSFISPFKSERDLVRRMMSGDEFIEIFVDTPLDLCVERDPKGLYKKALAGDIPNFTGITAPYEIPEAPDVVLQTANTGAESLTGQLIEALEARQIVNRIAGGT